MSDGETEFLMKGAVIALLSTFTNVYFDDKCNAANEEDKLENACE